MEKATKQATTQTRNSLHSFLSTIVDVDGLSPHLSELGLTQKSLINCDFGCHSIDLPTNGWVIELARFQQNNKLSINQLLRFFCRFTKMTEELPPDSARKLKKYVDDATTGACKLMDQPQLGLR